LGLGQESVSPKVPPVLADRLPEQVTVTWRYLLLSETDIKQATGSWAALKSLGT